jgi:hypothetical protein
VHELSFGNFDLSWPEIMKNPRIWAWSCTLKGRLFVWDPLLSLSLRLCWGMPSLTDVNWRMDPMLGKMLVTQLTLCNRGYMHSESYGWRYLTLWRQTDGKLFCNWSLLRRLRSSKHRILQFLNSTHYNKSVYFSLPHSPPHRQFLPPPHPAGLMRRGLHIPDIDGNIGGWQIYNKGKKVLGNGSNNKSKWREKKIRKEVSMFLVSHRSRWFSINLLFH